MRSTNLKQRTDCVLFRQQFRRKIPARDLDSTWLKLSRLQALPSRGFAHVSRALASAAIHNLACGQISKSASNLCTFRVVRAFLLFAA